jgi:AAA family ATP:ADP antiporter
MCKNLTRSEYIKFGLLSVTLAFIVGVYWLLRPIKDALFMNIVGPLYLPYAKVASIIFLILLILVYSKLVDIFKKQKLIYIITISYSLLFVLISLLLTHQTIGLYNTTPNKYRLLGWTIYLGVESFVSLVVALFWSFVASISDTQSAKHGYALIIAGAQFGTIIGPEFAKHATTIGIPLLFILAACATLVAPLIIIVLTKIQPQLIENNSQNQKLYTGFLEGLRLLCTKPYILGIFCVATMFGIIETILEIQMNYMSKTTYISTEKITEFLGFYGQCINIATLIIALIGTRFIIQKFGVTFALVAYPIIVGLLVCCVWACPTLFMLFIAMVLIKCLNYALNIPCKEILYIPTSKDVKFKAKSWIDTVGDRLTKGIGGAVSALFPIMTVFIFWGSVISLIVVAIWIFAASYVGKKNHQLLENKNIIE